MFWLAKVSFDSCRKTANQQAHQITSTRTFFPSFLMVSELFLAVPEAKISLHLEPICAGENFPSTELRFSKHSKATRKKELKS